MSIGCCGSVCDECHEYHKSCAGCHETQGKPAWISEASFGQCSFYECCIVKKGLDHCGNCSEMPCKMFYDCIDPSLSKEVAAKDIADRVLHLKYYAIDKENS